MTVSIDSKKSEQPGKILSDKRNHYSKDSWEPVTCFVYSCIGSLGYSFIGIVQKTASLFKRRLYPERGQ